MKNIKFLFFTIIILVVIFPINVFAAEQTGLQTSEINKNDLEKYKERYSVSLIDERPENLAIRCFDVSKSGLVAIGNEKGSESIIQVYDNNFNFIYGFTFEYEGSYNIEWRDEYISIYYIRSDIAVTYNEKAEIISIEAVDNTADNDIYLSTVLRDSEREIGGVKYKVKNDMGILNFFIGQSSYSQLVKIDNLGNEIILYDYNSFLLIKTIIVFLFIIIFVSFVIIHLVFDIKKNLSKQKRTDTGADTQ